MEDNSLHLDQTRIEESITAARIVHDNGPMACVAQCSHHARALMSLTRSPTFSIAPISDVENLILNARSIVSMSRM